MWNRLPASVLDHSMEYPAGLAHFLMFCSTVNWFSATTSFRSSLAASPCPWQLNAGDSFAWTNVAQPRPVPGEV